MLLCQTLDLTSKCNGQNYQEWEFHSNQNAVTESSLVILSTRFPRDHGKYTCSAKNSKGKDEGSVEISVYSKYLKLHYIEYVYLEQHNPISSF